MPLRFADGYKMQVPVACVPVDDPILLGANFMDLCVTGNPKNKIILGRKNGEAHACKTYKHEDRHRYLEVAPRDEGKQQYALMQGRWRTFTEKRKLASIVHDRTHASPASLRMLIERKVL